MSSYIRANCSPSAWSFCSDCKIFCCPHLCLLLQIVEIIQQIHVSPKIEHNEKIKKRRVLLDSSSTETLSSDNVNIFTTVKLMEYCLWKNKYKIFFDLFHHYSLYYTRISLYADHLKDTTVYFPIKCVLMSIFTNTKNM